MEVSINGPKILFTLPFFGGINVTESIVHTWIVMAIIAFVCWWLTRDLSVDNPGRKQIIAEKLVTMTQSLVDSNMGEKWRDYVPYIGTILAFSFLCSVMSIAGLRSPTADFSVTLAMALVTFAIIEYNYFKHKGFIGFFKRLTEPVIVMTPMNIISEVASYYSFGLWCTCRVIKSNLGLDTEYFYSKHTNCTDRYTGYSFTLLRLVLKCNSGLHFLYAHYGKHSRHGRLNE